MAKLFFSYSHKDEAFRDVLEVQLSMLRRQGLIESWHDRRILGGDEIDREVSQYLESADVILLLVSPDFLASDYCYDVEMTRALERHQDDSARVIPVILRPCDWGHAPFRKLLAAPKDGKPVTTWTNRDEAFLDVIQTIRQALPVENETSEEAASMTARPTAVRSAPRSSNLRLKKEFTEADKDRFLDDVFEHMALYFENSLAELQRRNPGIESRFKRNDANSFSAVIYREGNRIAECQIRNRGRGSVFSGISYSHEESSDGNSCNETLIVEADDYSLWMNPSFMTGIWKNVPEQLSEEGAAEHYWSLLIETLR
ncbi:MAG: toll/interleukin-1 receptor domain-containing protein [Synoicihabitans sp.]